MTTVFDTKRDFTLAVQLKRELLAQLLSHLEKLSQLRGEVNRSKKYEYLIKAGGTDGSLRYQLTICQNKPPYELLLTLELKRFTSNELRKIHKSLYSLLGEETATKLIKTSITVHASISFKINTSTKYRLFIEKEKMIYMKLENTFHMSASPHSFLTVSMRHIFNESEKSNQQWAVTMAVTPKLTGGKLHLESKKTITEKITLFCLKATFTQDKFSQLSYEHGINISNELDLKKIGINIDKGTKINLNIPIPTSWKAFISSMLLYSKNKSIFTVRKI